MLYIFRSGVVALLTVWMYLQLGLNSTVDTQMEGFS